MSFPDLSMFGTSNQFSPTTDFITNDLYSVPTLFENLNHWFEFHYRARSIAGYLCKCLQNS